MDVICVLTGVAALAVSGLPGLLFRRQAWAEHASVALMTLGGASGLIGCAVYLGGGSSAGLVLPWSIPWGRLALGLDAISVAFLVPVFSIPVLGAWYGLGYWSQAEHPETAAKLRVFYGLLAASMALVVTARDSVLFMIVWELMALAAFFLVTTEDDNASACQAGWHYLIATHLGSLCLMAMFVLLGSVAGGSALAPIKGGMGAGAMTAIFVLAVVGFGLKAGLMPLHVWLPGAHANAPTHVSAVLSGVMIKMGIYGIVRVISILPPLPTTLGGTLLAIGVVSGVLGVVLAIAQHDLKRLLAYHSIENIGIITMGLGLAALGRSCSRPDWVALGLGGALLHVWNHALFKSLLFFSAGSAIHAVGTREIDRMGGLARRMPWTAAMFLVGAVAICGLPPLNGFVSELLIYLGLFRTLGPGPSLTGVAFAVPALAMIGGLAVACFVKVFGVAFLGEPRMPPPARLHESPPSMLAPMFALAGACAAIGLFPTVAAPVLNRAVAGWATELSAPPVQSLAPLGWVSAMSILLAVCCIAGVIKLWGTMRRGAFATVGTWDCGYAAPNARMQYTASSFAEMLVGIFGWALRPRKHLPPITGPFPKPADFESHGQDVVLEGMVTPSFRAIERLLMRLRTLQHGRIQIYILYVLVIAVVLLIAAVWR